MRPAPSLCAVLFCLALLPAAALAATPEEEAANRDRSGVLLDAMDCSGKKGRLFYDYLTSTASLQGTLKFRCAAGSEKITAPAWLAAEVSSLTVNEVTLGKEKVAELKLWLEPLAALGEFNDLVRKTAPSKNGGIGLPQKFAAEGCRDLLGRLDKAVTQLGRAGLSCSFAKRGELVYASYAKALADLDNLERTFEIGNGVTFYEKAAAVMKNAEDAFAALFAEPPAAVTCGKFAAQYYAAPRLSDGLRALTLAFEHHELEGIKRGDRVDLLVTNDFSTGTLKDTITATIIQAAPVLNVFRPQDPASAAKASLTLLLSPVQAQYAALSAAQGRDLAVLLRAPGDYEPKAVEAASFKKIIK